MNDSFSHSTLGQTDLRVFRMGLSATYRPGKKTIYKAIDEGVNLFFYFHFDTHMVKVLRDVIKNNRDRYILCTGAYNFVWWKTNLRRTLERRLRQLKTDHVDIFLFLGVLRERDIYGGMLEELARFKEESKIKYIGISTHNRKLAGKLAADGKLDILMVRYNAAHRGAEQEIFPYLAAYNPGVISYTATRWRYMMRRPKGWPRDREIPSASMAYRFVLSNPNVDICMTAPSNIRQFKENLEAIRLGPLSAEEMNFMREFGDAVHAGTGKGLHRLIPFSRT